ncbi:hypothetical protein [Bartonella krasnovii]|nr:hypothetical protein [Bartonella krasnovii]
MAAGVVVAGAVVAGAVVRGAVVRGCCGGEGVVVVRVLWRWVLWW